MAQATTSTFGNFKILIGDGGSPTETFAPICGLTSKGISFDSDASEVEVPDCTNEDLPSYKEAGIKSNKVSITGSGMWAAQSHATLMNWWKAGSAKNIQIIYNVANSGDPQKISGPAIITKLGHQVTKGERLSADIAIEFTTMPTFTNAA